MRQPPHEPRPDLADMFATRETVTVPDWMREPVEEHELDRRDRLRLGWGRHGGKLLGALAVVLVVGFLGFLATLGWRAVDTVNRGGLAWPSRSPAAAPRPLDADGNTLDVYAGTPAERFAVGEAAIVLPAARPTGGFTEAQVTGALTAVRGALVEGRLRRGTVYGGPGPFLARLAPDARAGIRTDTAAGGNLGYLTRVSPDAQPDWVPDDGVRARGTMTYAALTTEDGVRVLTVTTRFLWVYSFDLFQAQAYPPGAELVTVRDEVVWHFPHPADVRQASRGLWIESAAATVDGASCAALRRGYLDLDTEPSGRPAPAASGDIYRPDWKPGDGEPC